MLIDPQFEINNPFPGGLFVVARDPGATEMRRGQPLVGRAGTQVFNPALEQAGLLRSQLNIGNICATQPPGNNFERHTDDEIEQGREALFVRIAELQPTLIVTLGNEAAFTLVEDWPTKRGYDADDVRGASGIEDRRGYIWRSRNVAGSTYKVLTSVHPAAVLRTWVPWRQLLYWDFCHAKVELKRGPEIVRPKREVIVVPTAA